MNVLSKGQIVIPAEIRHRYGIKPGTPVEIREVGD
ncbi:AbrB/MazE/SpoVT family DNA-binding domain-containing protein, partial [Methyloglobulus sp.]